MAGVGVQKYKVPNNFDMSECKEYLPAFLQEFEHFFYLNSEEPIALDNPANTAIGVFNYGSSVPVQVFTDLNLDSVSGGYMVSFSFELSANASGVHYFVLYDTSTEEVYADSNPFYIIEADEVPDYTLVEYKHSSNIDNIDYEAYDVYQSVFLHMDEIANQFEHTNEGYRERTSGNFRRQKNTRYKRIELETYLFDSEANDAMGSLSIHDDIVINKEPVTVKEAHEHENNRDFHLNKGAISFYVKRYSTINLNG